VVSDRSSSTALALAKLCEGKEADVSEVLWEVRAGHLLSPDATQGRTFTPLGVERLIPLATKSLQSDTAAA
jgi:hypothetical protein